MGRIDITPSQTSKSMKDWMRVLFGVVVSLVCIAILVYFVDLEEFADALRKANYWLVLAAGLLTLIWLLLRSYVWRTILQEKASYAQVFFTLNEGYLLNNFLPFRLGEVGRAFLLSRKAHLGFWQVLSSIILERSMDVAIASLLLLSTLPFVVGAEWARQAALIAGGLIVLFFAFLYLMFRFNKRIISYLESKTESKTFFIKPILVSINGLVEGLEVLGNRSRLVKAGALMIVNWIVGIGQYYIFMIAFIPEAKLLWSGFCLGVAALGVAAPSSPGAIGVFELSLVGSLAVFSVTPSISLAFALTIHILQYIITGIFGIYALTQDGESLASFYLQTRRVKAGDS